ncbi:MAG: transposase [Bacteroidota bacterium]|nr:transposase [Bacteroidota bacterium]
MAKFMNKYRIDSHRRPGWDYAADGIYFITLVTQHRIHHLGEIVMTETHGCASLPAMQLSDFGRIVKTEWMESFEMRSELFLDEYVIMPNHIHAIIVLDKTNIDSTVETHGRASLQQQQSTGFIRRPRSVSSFIGGFKSRVNTKINNHIDIHQPDSPKFDRHDHFFQPNYHDHIIRNEQSYQRIKNYIIDNPLNWDADKFNNSEQ